MSHFSTVMNDVTINIFVLFAFFSFFLFCIFPWGLFQKWEDWVKVYEQIFLLFLYIARQTSRGMNTCWKCQIRQWDLEKWWLNWKEWACILHQIPFQSSALRSIDLSVGEGCWEEPVPSVNLLLASFLWEDFYLLRGGFTAWPEL